MVSNKVIFLKYPADILHKYFTKLQAITGGKLMKDKILKYFFSLRDMGQEQRSSSRRRETWHFLARVIQKDNTFEDSVTRVDNTH